MKTTIKIANGETTAQYVNRITAEYLEKHERVVPIEEVRQFFVTLGDPTVKNMTKSGFTRIVGNQIVEHAMKYM